MSKMYMIIYGGLKPPRKDFVAWMEVQPKILNWHASTLYSLFVVIWDGGIEELRDVLKETGMDMFVVIESGQEKVGKEIQGWLSKGTWDFIQKNEPKIKTSPVPEIKSE